MGFENNDRNSGVPRVFVPYEKEKKGPAWLAIAIMLGVFWPVGTVMLVRKIHVSWHNKKMCDFRNYAAIIADRSEVSVREFAAKMDKTPEHVMSDLQTMIDRGYMGNQAYIDKSRRVLVLEQTGTESAFTRTVSQARMAFEDLTDSARRAARVVRDEVRKSSVSESIKVELHRAFDTDAMHVQEKRVDEAQENPQPAAEPKPQTDAPMQQDDYEQKLREIRRLNDEIDDAPVSARIDRIEELARSIFAVVRQKPERADEVRRFMNYYLPTTFKLLESYALMEKQSYQGENIVASRKKIEDILDTLISAFEQQQDRLFRAEALDVEADIHVLETMMAKDGLVTPKGMDMRSMGGRQ